MNDVFTEEQEQAIAAIVLRLVQDILLRAALYDIPTKTPPKSIFGDAKTLEEAQSNNNQSSGGLS